MIRTIVNETGFNIQDIFDSVHNFIDEYDVIRKGATSANEGQRLIIPLNMRDGSLICEGLGNEDWNYSAPHGASRIMSRSQAKETLELSEYEDDMKGIYTTSVKKSNIDESPRVYKDKNEIIDNISDTCRIIHTLKPVYNYKA